MVALDKRLYVFGYKMGSKSAAALAEELDVWIIKHEDSEWVGSPSKNVINWGAGTGVFNADLRGARVFNTPGQIDTAVNKLDFFRAMRGKDAPRVPFWTQNNDTALGWLYAGYSVLARTKLEGMKGSGMVCMNSPVDFTTAPLYTVKVNSTHEYRVYMFNGEVLDARIKLLSNGQQGNPDNLRHEEKYEFCQLNGSSTPLGRLPEDVAVQAKKCIRKIGLMTGGVDVLWDNNTGQAFCLEINTAPYIGSGTAKKYADAFKEYLDA